VPDALVVVDEAGAVITLNTRAEALFGWSRQELAGQAVEVLVPEALRAGHAARRAAFALAPGIRSMGSGVLRALRRDGVELDVEVSLAPYGHAGRRWFIAALRDCSERVRTAEKERRLEEELRQAQKMEGIGRLAGGIAHDFNNLLSVVLGLSTALLDELPMELAVRADVRQIAEAAQRATALTQQLLAFSRRQILEPRVVAVGRLVRSLEPMLRRVIGEDIEFCTAFDDDVGRARVDAGQMEQVILNLVFNARDAMPSGGRLLLEARNADLDETYAASHAEVVPGRYVMLAVGDTGAGMDAATAARVFEPFFTTKPPGKGTGLGLSTAHGIVRQSGGHIGIESEVGRGSAFRVYLPRVDESETIPSKAPETTQHTGRGEIILLVEDDDLVRTATRRLLVRAGYEVIETGDPLEALEIVELHPRTIALLLTDVVMPRMGGPSLADHATTLRPEVRVLFMSGYTDGAIVNNGVLTPGTAFLQKPVTSATLTRRVREVLDQPAGARACRCSHRDVDAR
jgi:PAS domain S-box-containing protein